MMTMALTAYCLKCKADREIKNPQQVTLRSGKPAITGSCSFCGNSIFRIEEALPGTVPGSRLYCWCGRSLGDMYCEGCSSRPFVCQCNDGAYMKVSQQFQKLPKLVQERFRSLDLSQVWQKTPSELTPDERTNFVPQILSPPQNPVLKILNFAVTASSGEPVDLGQVAKAFPGAKLCSWKMGTSEDEVGTIYSQYILTWAPQTGNGSLDLGPKMGRVFVHQSGRITCPLADSEVKARGNVEEVVRELKERKVKVPSTPMWTIQVGPAVLFLGRGIAIQSLPEKIPDSLYARTLEGKIEGKYNRAGQIIPLASEEDVARRVSELADRPPSRIPRAEHIAYCRVGKPPVIAEMFWGNDLEGSMWMTGCVKLSYTNTEGAMQETARNLGQMLDEAGLLGPLTPLDKIHEDFVAANPRAFDIYANDTERWEGR